MQSKGRVLFVVILIACGIEGFMNILRPPPMPCNQGRCPPWQQNNGSPCVTGMCPPQSPWRPMIQPCGSGQCPPWTGHPHGSGGVVQQQYGAQYHGATTTTSSTTSSTTTELTCISSKLGICVESCTLGIYTKESSLSCAANPGTVCCVAQ